MISLSSKVSISIYLCLLLLMGMGGLWYWPIDLLLLFPTKNPFWLTSITLLLWLMTEDKWINKSNHIYYWGVCGERTVACSSVWQWSSYWSLTLTYLASSLVQELAITTCLYLWIIIFLVFSVVCILPTHCHSGEYIFVRLLVLVKFSLCSP